MSQKDYDAIIKQALKIEMHKDGECDFNDLDKPQSITETVAGIEVRYETTSYGKFTIKDFESLKQAGILGMSYEASPDYFRDSFTTTVIFLLKP